MKWYNKIRKICIYFLQWSIEILEIHDKEKIARELKNKKRRARYRNVFTRTYELNCT